MKPSLRTARRGPRLNCEQLEDRSVPATLLALTSTQVLLMFDDATPNQVVTSPVISNLSTSGESIVSIDSRPANGVVYGLSNLNLLYTLDPFSGVATRVGAGAAAFAQVGSRIGIDFNPTVDRLRIDTNGEQNFRIHPITGAIVDGDGGTGGVQPDTALAYGTGPFLGVDPAVVEVAYDRNFQGSTQTTLYGIDADLNRLVLIGSVNGTPNSPNGGALTVIGGLGADVQQQVGFEITASGAVFATLIESDGVSRLESIDLTTGRATRVGTVGDGTFQIIGLTELPRDEIIFATTTSNRLVSFRASDPDTLLTTQPITGLNMSESIAGIDFRPLNGELFALTSTNRVLTIDTATAVATEVNAGLNYTPAFLAGSPNGFDFNPTVDRLRLVNADNDNARYNPNTNLEVDSDNNGANGNTPDTDLAYIATDTNVGADPNIVADAYDRNDNNANTATTLFGIDSTLNVLVRQGAVDGNAADVAGGGSPNGGLLTTLGSLGVDPTDLVGFDIIDNGRNGQGAALAVIQLQGETVSKLFQINLTPGLTNQPVGTASLVGTVGGGELITAMAIAPPRIQFAVANFTVTENQLQAEIIATRTGGSGNPSSGTGSVTTAATFNTADGTAIALEDYQAVVNGAVTFAQGVTTVIVPILIERSDAAEPAETVSLALTNVVGGSTVLGTPSTATLTITEVPPSPPPPPPPAATTGASAAGGVVTVTKPDGSTTAVTPFAGFQGEITTATGDVNNDGTDDIIVGSGVNAHVKALDGVTGAEIRSFFAFPGFGGGVYVAAGDVTGDGIADIVAGATISAHVKVFDGVTGAEVRSFFAYTGFGGEVRVAVGDVNGDGRADIVTGAGPGVGPHVKAFSGIDGSELRSFFAFAPTFTGGVYVAAGDVDNDGFDDIVVGTGPGIGAQGRVFDGETLGTLADVVPFGPDYLSGARVGARDVNGDGFADVLVGSGPGTRGHVKVFDGQTFAEIDSDFTGETIFNGVYVS